GAKSSDPPNGFTALSGSDACPRRQQEGLRHVEPAFVAFKDPGAFTTHDLGQVFFGEGPAARSKRGWKHLAVGEVSLQWTRQALIECACGERTARSATSPRSRSSVQAFGDTP